MSLDHHASVFQALKLRTSQKKRDAFHLQYYEAMLKVQSNKNELISEFQEESAKANQDAISFYNARKEKLNRTVKQFEEDELRAKRTAVAERFLSELKKICVALTSTAYKTLIGTTLRGIDSSSFTLEVFLQFTRALCNCQEIRVDDLQRILAVCLQVDANCCKDLQSLHLEAGKVIERLVPLLQSNVENLTQSDLEALGGSLSYLVNSDIGSRIVHHSVDQARNLLNTIRVRLEDLRRQQMLQQQQSLMPKPKDAASINSNNSNSSSSSSGGGGGGGGKSHLSYVEESKTTSSWLSKLERSSSSVTLPGDVSASVDQLVSLLQFGSKAVASAANISGGNEDSMEAATAATDNGVPDVVDILKALSDCLSRVISLGSAAFIQVFLSLMRVILSEVQQATSESAILLYAALLTGVFEALPSSMVKESSKIVRSMMLSLSRVCIPDFLPSIASESGSSSSGSSTSVKPCDEKSVRILTLQSALIGRAPYIASPPLNAEEGWTWLVRSTKQLSFVLSNGLSDSTTAVKTTLVNDICRCIRVVLKFSGFALHLRYQEQVTSVLSSLATTVGKCTEDEAVKLTAFLTRNKVSFPPLYHDQQTPLALKAQELTCQLSISKNEVTVIDADKSLPIFETIRQHQIDRLRVIFNKLSATVESQTAAVSSLLEKLLIASKVSPELLRYTLFKISNNIISDSQEDHFTETDEGHPTKLARVSCGLCREIQDLSSVMQAQFYDQCPLTIPRGAKEGLTGEEFLTDLRFRKKKSGVWEDKQQWLTRMTKILSTFAVIVIQPEQIPFSLLDGWRWLASLVNAACVSPSGAPPFYVATALEVFLRITSQKMLSVFGDAFMQLLRAIQSTLLPRMNEEMPRRQCLAEFLQRFIDSNGQDFMTLFQR